MVDCLFCKIAAKQIPSQVVYEDDEVFAFKDINPAAPVHILLIPKKHIATLSDLNDADESLAGRILLTARKIAAEQGLDEKGYRVVANCRESAGQTVFHLHFHLLGGRSFAWPPG